MATARTLFVLLGTLLLVACVDAQPGGAPPPETRSQVQFRPQCKNTASKAVCDELLAKGKCFDLKVFKICPMQCDPRCDLPKGKRCKDKKPAWFCTKKREQGKCHKLGVAKKCAKICGKCRSNNQIPDSKCKLIAGHGWCGNKVLSNLCPAACNPLGKPVECKVGDVCHPPVCLNNNMSTFTCDSYGECQQHIEHCKCGCHWSGTACRPPDDSCCFDDSECEPWCDLYPGILMTARCKKPDGGGSGRCIHAGSISCPCGCESDACMPCDFLPNPL